MKRKIVVLAMAAMLAAAMTACGSTKTTDEAVETTDTANTATFAELNTEEYIALGDYTAFDVTVAPKMEVTDEDVDMYLKQYVLPTYEITDKNYVVKEGDKTNIDYVGKKDGTAFDGGTAAGYNLTIGSGAFIPGFEDGLIGAKVGETRDINLTFPEDYHVAELAGANVVFTVTVNYVYANAETEMTDEFAAAMNPQTPTLAEYRAYTKELLEQDAQTIYDNTVYNEITKVLMDNSEVKQDAPEELVKRYFDQAVAYAKQYAMANFNVDYETFIKAGGSTVEAYEAGMRAQALEYANHMVMYQAVANAEGIEVTEDEMQAEAEKNAEAGGFASAEAYLATIDQKELKDYMMRTEVLKFLAERATVTEKEPEAAEATEETVVEK